MNSETNAKPQDSVSPRSKSALPIAGLGLFLLICLGCLISSTWANLDLDQERAVLFMDEQIVHDGIVRIYEAETPREFCFAVLDGYDQRYGRILFNTCALTSYLPYKIWGAPGLIVATRSTITVIQLAAFVLLALAFFDGWWWRSAALLALVLLPYTSYYGTTPKPEPLQLLFLALFLWAARRREFRLGAHWIYLGLAFGAKISALPIVFVFGCAALWQAWVAGVKRKEFIRTALVSAATFLAGWIIAVPVIASFNPVKYGEWWRWTFGDMTHGADNRSVTIFTWLSDIFNGQVFMMALPLWFVRLAALGTLLLLAGAIVYFAARLLRDRRIALPPEVILAGVTLASTLPIMLKVKRTWGMYLHVGMAFGCVAALIVLARIAARIDLKLRKHVVSAVTAVSCLAIVGFAAVRPNLVKYDILAHRTDEPIYQWQISVYHQAEALLKKLHGVVEKNRPGTTLNVIYDPILYTPTFRQGYYIAPIWGPLTEWPAVFDVVVLSDLEHVRYMKSANLSALVSPGNLNFPRYVQEQQAYRDNVRDVAGHGDFTLYSVIDDKAYVFVNTKRMPFLALKAGSVGH